MVYINNTAYPFKQNQTIEQLFDQLNIEIIKGMAVAINEQVISKTNWATHTLIDNDKLLIIKAAQGG